MELQTLTMSGFRSYSTRTTIDFRAIPYAAIVGNNGTGKTSMLEAIEWAIYGTSRSRDASGVITIGKTECEVELRFTVGGAEYLIKRTRQSRTKAGGGTLDLFACGSEACLSEKTTALTQIAVTTLIGIGRDAFLSCAMIKQGDHGRFTNASPRDRRALLREMLRLSKWDDVAKVARERAADETRFVAMHEAELARPDAMSAPAELESAVSSVSGWEAEIAKSNAALVCDVAELGMLADAAEDARRALSDVTMLEAAHTMATRTLIAAEDSAAFATRQRDIATKRLDRSLECERILSGECDELVNAEAERERIDATLGQDGIAARTASNACSKLRTGWAAANAEHRAVKARIKQSESESAVLGDVPCDEPCGRRCPLLKLAHDRRDSITGLHFEEGRLAETVRQLGASGEREATNAKSLAEKYEAGMRRRDQLLSEIQELRRPFVGAEFTLREIGSSADARRDVSAATDGVSATTKIVATAREALASTPRPDVNALRRSFVSASDAHAESEGRVETMRSHVHECSRTLARTQTRVEAFQMSVNAIASRREEMAQHQLSAQRWKRALAAATIAPVLLIEEFAIPAIEGVANDVLRSISDGMSIRIETQRALKSGRGVSEKIDIIVRDGVGERPFEDFSGGEQFRVNIAIALALSSLAQHDSTSPPNCIFIDEGWGSLDRDGIAALSDVVAGLQEFYDIVWIITHVEAAAECLPAQVRVSCGSEGSTIEFR